jgi:gamma-D-glutamyl-L-lysine dipeptidyl-peptidase
MKYGISVLSIVPLRAYPAEQSEMVSQLLFGDFFEIIDYKGNWFKIRNHYDKYIGWIDSKLCEIISKRYYNSLIRQQTFTLKDPIKQVFNKENGSQLLLAGSSIPNYKGKMAFRVNGKSYRIAGKPQKIDLSQPRENLAELAKSYLNAPYLWGGRSHFGIDCSGFVQIIYKMLQVTLPRDASQQVKYGKVIDFVNEAKVGDLAFFDNQDGRIIHVGIILDAGRIIHASGKVRIDLIDHAGICDMNTGKYSHQLRVVKNILDNPGEPEILIQTELF